MRPFVNAPHSASMPDESATHEEIAALVRLLDDPDETVQRAIRARLDALGRDALPALRAAREDADEPLAVLIDAVVQGLHFDDIRAAWTANMDSSNTDLERGAFLLALYRFPALNIASYRKKLDDLALAVQPRIEAASGVERAFILSQYLCQELGFSGNREHYYDPNNSYLNWVVDHRMGIPVSLSVVFLLLGRRLGLPIHGVNMPAHFLVKYEDGRNEVFLDLFNGGTPFLKEDGLRFLLKAGIKPRPEYFAAADTRNILLRMVRNLLAIAHETSQQQMLEDMMQLLEPWSANKD